MLHYKIFLMKHCKYNISCYSFFKCYFSATILLLERWPLCLHINQLWWHRGPWMLAFKVLLKGLRVWHLCLEKHLKGKKILHLKKEQCVCKENIHQVLFYSIFSWKWPEKCVSGLACFHMKDGKKLSIWLLFKTDLSVKIKTVNAI